MTGYGNVTCGTYMIRNKKTGQIYIGQSTNIERRFIQHRNPSPLDVDIAIQGADNFVFSVIEETSPDKLNEREKYWIKHYNTYEDEHHYNTNAGVGYTLWATFYCHYNRTAMYNRGRIPNPCKCFRLVYDGYRIPIGKFYDFTSCEIINQLIKEAIKDEIK